MKKTSLTSRQIEEIRLKGRYLVTPAFVIKYLKNDSPECRLAFAISRHHGNAITRNRYKRRLRHFLLYQNRFQGLSFVCQSRRSLTSLTATEWHAHYERILEWCATIS